MGKHHRQCIFIGELLQQAPKNKHIATEGGESIYLFAIHIMNSDRHAFRPLLGIDQMLGQTL